MKIDLVLYLLCIVGGFAVYLLFNGVLYVGLYKRLGSLLYRGVFSVVKEKVQVVTSCLSLVAVMFAYYMFRREQGNMRYEMYLFVLFVGFLAGRTLFPLITGYYLPTGIYDHGIVSRRGIALYKDIKRHDIYDTGRGRDEDVLFLRLFTTKYDFLGAQALMIDKKDKGKVEKLLRGKLGNT